MFQDKRRFLQDVFSHTSDVNVTGKGIACRVRFLPQVGRSHFLLELCANDLISVLQWATNLKVSVQKYLCLETET